jgi:hypothetical protein
MPWWRGCETADPRAASAGQGEPAKPFQIEPAKPFQMGPNASLRHL